MREDIPKALVIHIDVECPYCGFRVELRTGLIRCTRCSQCGLAFRVPRKVRRLLPKAKR